MLEGSLNTNRLSQKRRAWRGGPRREKGDDTIRREEGKKKDTDWNWSRGQIKVKGMLTAGEKKMAEKEREC